MNKINPSIKKCSYFIFLNYIRVNSNNLYKFENRYDSSDPIEIFQTKIGDLEELTVNPNNDIGYKHILDSYGEIDTCCIKFSFQIENIEQCRERAEKIIKPLLHSIIFAADFRLPPKISGYFNIIDDEPINYTYFSKPEKETNFHLNNGTIGRIKELEVKFSTFENLNFQIGIYRYTRGLTEYFLSNSIEGVVDLMIAIEAVMSEKSDNLKYKISMRAAKFIGKKQLERKAIYALFSAFYDIRSMIVHGSNFDEKVILKKFNNYKKLLDLPSITFDETFKTFSQIINQIFLKILDCKITNCQYFDDLLLE
ncbi:HEPN domain-containing protein [Leptospira bandrabouensis]|uniref:Uncharacterized protein n=1 Tax=Leptospira bandrabouensis TaxID=2484903 RepID=A0A6H3NVP6_9LEPT|nr:HEPN domain-containing protein [Leptospira bandrabouensis]TGN13336.1 hypothetical protein EHR08_11690 [Leptospira bandrabouensis]